MKRVIVTGGAGFIGSHLCKRLLEEGNYVVCLDNFFTGSRDNIQCLINNSNFVIVEHDIVNPIPNYLGEVDEIYNLACPASPPFYQADPVKTTKTSVIGIINVLEYAKKHEAKVLQASTSEVYGDPIQHPQNESYWGNVNPVGLRSCYDEGKRCAETLMMDYHRMYGIRTKIIRIFNTYGTNMNVDDGRVVTNFIKQALLNEDITIYGDGSQTRSFQYVDDLIDGIMKVMSTSDDFVFPVNLGNPVEFTIKELAEKVISLSNSSSHIVYKELPSDDPKQRKPDISLARSIGHNPKIRLEEGLYRMIEYIKFKLKN